ncbi:MAG: cystathionine beta-lyase PatB [Gammaproteobacteria bacterium]|nr:MAG: cystathionine beta-lyase PatB [Gammaproteobacteria bacterium]
MDLNRVTDRRGTDSYKWDDTLSVFGRADLLPFWVADMDFATPEPILQAIRDRSSHPVLGYGTRSGVYFEAVMEWLERRHGWRVPREWLMFCPPSSIVGMYGLVTLLTEPGSGIVLQTPTYGALYDLVAQNGREQILLPLRESGGRFEFAVDDLASRLRDDTRMMILCSPHNPTGRVFTAQELEPLAALAAEHDLIVVSDEVHCDLVLPGQRHIPYGTLGGERSVTVISPNKTFNTAGIPQATLIIPDARIRARFQTFLDTTQLNHDSTFGAVGMMAAYRHCGPWLDQVIKYVADNHRYVSDYLAKQVPAVRKVSAEATYLAWLDCRDTGLPEGEIMRRLVEQGGVALYAGSEFGAAGTGFFRMNIGCPRETLERGLHGIKKALG